MEIEEKDVEALEFRSFSWDCKSLRISSIRDGLHSLERFLESKGVSIKKQEHRRLPLSFHPGLPYNFLCLIFRPQDKTPWNRWTEWLYSECS